VTSSRDGILTAMAQGSGFSGKRCFITGAASGIGRATAHAVSTGSSLAYTAAALPTIRFANASGVSPGSRGAKPWVS